jgi:hypothetical protein
MPVVYVLCSEVFMTPSLIMETERVSETSDINFILTWLIIRENLLHSIVMKPSNIISCVAEIHTYHHIHELLVIIALLFQF